MMGCCKTGNCIFHTTCVDLKRAKTEPSLANTPAPFTKYCLGKKESICETYSVKGFNLWQHQCGSTSVYSDIVTTALSTTGKNVTNWWRELSRADNGVVSDFTSSYLLGRSLNQMPVSLFLFHPPFLNPLPLPGLEIRQIPRQTPQLQRVPLQVA